MYVRIYTDGTYVRRCICSCTVIYFIHIEIYIRLSLYTHTFMYISYTCTYVRMKHFNDCTVYIV